MGGDRPLHCPVSSCQGCWNHRAAMAVGETCCNFCRFQLNAGAGSRAGASLGKALSGCRGCCGVGVSWGGGLLGWAPPIPVSHGGHYQCQGAACYSWLAPGDAQSNGRGQQERAEREKGWWPQLARCCLRRLCDTRPAAGCGCFTKGSSCPGTRLPAVPPCSPSAAEGQGRAPRRPTDLRWCPLATVPQPISHS